MPDAPPLFTIGYEGADIAAFIGTLNDAGVEIVLDIRAAPITRKPDFAKSRLSGHLAEAGIGYRHLRGLGTPKAGREAAARGDRAGFWRIFRAQMDSPEGLPQLAEAMALSRRESVCLLCLERDAHRCHRLMVAERMAAETGQEVRYLVPGVEPSNAAPRLL